MDDIDYVEKMLPAVIDQLKLIKEAIFSKADITLYLYRSLNLSIEALENIDAILSKDTFN